MPIDPDVAIGAEIGTVDFSWTESDVLLYHLAIGAGAREGDNVNASALRYTLDDANLQVLPSFGVVAPSFHATDPPPLDFPGCDLDLMMLLHASQSVEVHQPLPTSGSATLTTRITDIWDKGKAAVIWQEGTALAPDGSPLWTVRSSVFARGEGGFGGERGPSVSVDLPDRAPDAEIDYAVPPQQALLYRLCGDRNPLHADPEFAAGAGFDAPILHGLGSYGIVLREVTDALLDSDATRVGKFQARFAGVVVPGDTITIRAWDEGDQILVTAAGRDGAPVLADCVLTRADN